MTQTATSSASDTLIWNFKVLGHHTLDGFGGMGEGMSMQRAKDGRRILWLAHESAPKNYTAGRCLRPEEPEDRRPRRPCQSRICAPIRWKPVGDVMAIAYQTPEARAATGRLRAVRHLGAGNPEADRLCRPIGADLARRPSAVVRRRRIHPHELGCARLAPDPPERRSVLPVLGRQEPVEARRGWPLVAAGDPGGRQRPAADPPSRGQ